MGLSLSGFRKEERGLDLWPGSQGPLRGGAPSEGPFREPLSQALVLRTVGPED